MQRKSDTPKRPTMTVLKPEDPFRFACHKGLACFTKCCCDTSIFLTPYDVLRLKNALGVSSGSFLQDYTMRFINAAGLPVVLLKMGSDAAKSCPFVTPEGCRVYPHRPWSCRMYPLQPENTPVTEKAGKLYHSVMDVPFCLGFLEDKVSTVAQWQEQQGIPVYLEMEKVFRKITQNAFLSDKKIENDKIRQMYYMACYDLDRFRSFVFESTFLDRFETNPNQIEEIKHDDTALYKFAMNWLEYGLVGQYALKLKAQRK